jgi:hypothetical protein
MGWGWKVSEILAGTEIRNRGNPLWKTLKLRLDALPPVLILQ